MLNLTQLDVQESDKFSRILKGYNNTRKKDYIFVFNKGGSFLYQKIILSVTVPFP